MIRIFTPNENGNIELSKEDLEKLLLEAYNEGKSTYVKPDSFKINEISTTPYTPTHPPYITWTANNTPSLSNNLNTVVSDSSASYTITAKGVEVKPND